MISIILVFGLGAFIMWLYMEKIHMKCVLNEKNELLSEVRILKTQLKDVSDQLKTVTKNRDELLHQHQQLAFFDQLTKAKQYEESATIDPAMKPFIHE